jgi:hypothetical protein
MPDEYPGPPENPLGLQFKDRTVVVNVRRDHPVADIVDNVSQAGLC